MSTTGTKLFILIRNIIFPFSEIEPFVPKSGNILDVGCGHGTLISLLSREPGRKLIGIDPSKAKIKEANKLFKSSNTEFISTTLDQSPNKKYDCVIIIDVLYLMPYSEKLKLLKEAKKRLKSNGVLLLKEIIKTKSLMYYLILLEEFIMMRLLKLTYSNSKRSEVLTEKQHKELLEEAGFKLHKIKKISALLPYPHTLFVSKGHSK